MLHRQTTTPASHGFWPTAKPTSEWYIIILLLLLCPQKIESKTEPPTGKASFTRKNVDIRHQHVQPSTLADPGLPTKPVKKMSCSWGLNQSINAPDKHPQRPKQALSEMTGPDGGKAISACQSALQLSWPLPTSKLGPCTSDLTDSAMLPRPNLLRKRQGVIFILARKEMAQHSDYLPQLHHSDTNVP